MEQFSNKLNSKLLDDTIKESIKGNIDETIKTIKKKESKKQYKNLEAINHLLDCYKNKEANHTAILIYFNASDEEFINACNTIEHGYILASKYEYNLIANANNIDFVEFDKQTKIYIFKK